MTSRNPTDEASVQGTVMKEANDENSSAIGCEVERDLGAKWLFGAGPLYIYSWIISGELPCGFLSRRMC
jgi:hypothetical protein